MADRFIPKRCAAGSSSRLLVGRAAANRKSLIIQRWTLRLPLVPPALAGLSIGVPSASRPGQPAPFTLRSTNGPRKKNRSWFVFSLGTRHPQKNFHFLPLLLSFLYILSVD